MHLYRCNIRLLLKSALNSLIGILGYTMYNDLLENKKSLYSITMLDYKFSTRPPQSHGPRLTILELQFHIPPFFLFICSGSTVLK